MKVMGIVNTTPDSFSDGGAYAPLDHALRLCDEGADMVDIGGESTRPGAAEVSPREERQRVLPVIRALRAARPALRLSIDTRRAEVARAALEAGVHVVNDVSAGADPEMFPLCAEAGCGMVLVHMRGTPATMQALAAYRDGCEEVWLELGERATVARAAGVPEVWLDPGIGFAKTAAQSWALLRDLPNHRDNTLLVGASRKSFLGLLPGAATPADRLPGSLAVALWCRDAGAAVIRVHDVAATRSALAAWARLGESP